MSRASPRPRTSGAWPTIALGLTASAWCCCAAAEPFAGGAAGTLRWDLAELSRAMRLPGDSVRDYFTDGRRVSFLLERRIASEVLHGRTAPSEGAPFDAIDSFGGRWEVRSISRHGIYFCPSNMVGSSRHFEERGFLEKLKGIRGYVVADIESFPDVPYWRVTSEQVLQWWRDGALGADSKVSREKALALFGELQRGETVGRLH